MVSKPILVLASFLSLFALIKVCSINDSRLCNPQVYSRSVYIGNGRGNGTGVILNDKYILTAKHVTNGEGRVIVAFAPGKIGIFPVLYESPDHDFAIVSNMPGSKQDKVKVNYNIVLQGTGCVVGNPVTGSFISANPIMLFISWAVGPGGEIDKYVVFLPRGVASGFSGGGIFNDKDELLTIVTWCGMAESICGGIPISTIETELARTKFKLS